MAPAVTVHQCCDPNILNLDTNPRVLCCTFGKNYKYGTGTVVLEEKTNFVEKNLLLKLLVLKPKKKTVITSEKSLKN